MVVVATAAMAAAKKEEEVVAAAAVVAREPAFETEYEKVEQAAEEGEEVQETFEVASA